MTLRIERTGAQIRLSGELRFEQLDELRSEIELCGLPAVLDLEEVGLADVQGVRFLNVCEAEGVTLLHCSPYIRAWMLRERARPELEKQKDQHGRPSG